MKKQQPTLVTVDDQDSAWKELLDECLPDCLSFFFPDVARAIDWTKRWIPLDKELARLKENTPDGKLYADKLDQVWLKNGQIKWLLIHLEVPGRAERGFARRVFDYNYRINRKYLNANLVSLVIITETKRPVMGRYERAALGCSLVFTFPLAQLAAYADKMDTLMKNPNPFALAVAAQLKALETRGDNQRRYGWKKDFVTMLLDRKHPRKRSSPCCGLLIWQCNYPKRWKTKFRKPFIKSRRERKCRF
jgi:hypothetical protein